MTDIDPKFKALSMDTTKDAPRAAGFGFNKNVLRDLTPEQIETVCDRVALRNKNLLRTKPMGET